MPEQTLEVGEPAVKIFGEFGMSNVSHVAPFRKSLTVCVGPHGSGKTSFFSYCPGALILNADMHSVPRSSADAPPCTAQFFPALDTQGMSVDAQGKRFRPTWEHFERMKDNLIIAADRDKPRPDFVVMDSIIATISLKKPWIAKTQMSYPSWDKIPDGNPTMTAWGKLYDSYVPWIMALRNAGYGVFIIAQVISRVIKTMESGQRTERRSQVIALPDLLWERLQPFVEMLFTIEKKRVTIKNAQGAPTGKETKWLMINHSEKLADATRCRVPLADEIELTKVTTAFNTVETAYKIAAGETPAS